MSRRRPVKTREQARDYFNRVGKSVRQWARENGYHPNLVYGVLSGRFKCHRGKSHEIAVLLGIKEGVIVR